MNIEILLYLKPPYIFTFLQLQNVICPSSGMAWYGYSIWSELPSVCI